MTFPAGYDPKSLLTKLTILPAQQRVFGLDLMRAVAILAVLLTHAQLVLPVALRAYIQYPASVGGVLGVELFFVLSGFLIGSILLSLAPAFDNIRILPSFWQRRWFRTLPNYFLFLILSIAAFLVTSNKIPNILLYLTFTQNWLWPHPGFFAQAWSLAVEEWFYLLFPISLFLIYRLSKSFTAAFLLSAGIFIVIPTLVRIQWADASVGLPNWDTIRKIMFIRLDAIMYGVLAAWAKKRFPQAWVKSRFLLLAAGFAIVFFSWYFATKQGLNSSFFAKTFLFSLISVGFACLLPIFDQWEVSKENLITRSLRLVALWSYSLYLCNLLVAQVLLFIQEKIGEHSLPVDVIFFVLFYLFCMALSSIVYTYFEKPAMDLRDKFSKVGSSVHTQVNMKPPERIETNRLVLRAPTLGDAPVLFNECTQSPEVTRYVMWRPHKSIDQTREFLNGCVEAWKGERRFPFVITLKGLDRPIGMIEFNINGSTVGIGYVIGRAYWGNGYVPEAARAIVDWAFSQPSVYRVTATCDVDNAASARVMEKVGMQREGLLRRYVIHPNISDEPRDAYIYAIVK